MTHASMPLVLRNARIITFDDANPRASAIALRDGKIIAIGSDADVPTPPDAREIDLGGACVIPGFNDTHAHMEREGLKHQRPSLAHAGSVADILDTIRGLAARTSPGQWIITMPAGKPPFYFDGVASLAEKRLPNRYELDAVAPDHPFYIPGVFGNWGKPPGHSALNSRALALNGIDAGSAARCSGVEIETDGHGQPTGIIVERNNRPTVEFDLLPAVPRFGFAERLEGVRLSQRLYNANGTTSIYEGHGSAAETISVYRRLWELNELTVRVGLVVSPSWSDLTEARRIMRDWLATARGSGLGDPWLRVSGIHLAYGGDPVVAHCAKAHLPDTGWSGFVEQAVTPADFREASFLAAEFDLRLHTIVGDRLHEILPVLEAVNARFPLRERRWVIEHIGRAREADLHALARLGVLVTTIPTYYLWKGGEKYLDEPDGGDLVVPHRRLLNAGVPLAIATDNIPYDPFFTLWVTCAREERLSGRVIGPEQRLNAEEALRLFTVNGARLTFDESWKGPLKPGFAADLAVLSNDPTTLQLAEIKNLRCGLTIVSGRIVHDDMPTPRARR
ncbi:MULTISPECIES: amidohydrolase [unclassified Bradyrhizobium]|uniref:amidohydrolase n=1 Tax=unclassified Bradyrhizobium TaxID=2631580 RepID=UPI0024490223|nr:MULTISPECIES: amidohydrolase [unclassified Bradyrhizobium]MDH2344049.1 amidohydrolase [Bradyrhizobium sp. SSUT77]MDH2350358.1 amidohydrolase [Bradyrhizobium sp. SSUT112]